MSHSVANLEKKTYIVRDAKLQTLDLYTRREYDAWC